MNEQLQHRVQAWVDGELPPAEAAEVAAWIEQDPQALALAKNLRAFTGVLRENEPVRAVPDSREFYWSQLRRGIEQAERVAAPPVEARSGSPLRWLAWLLPLSAAALAVLFFVHPTEPYPSATPVGLTPTLTGHVVETPSEEVSSLTFYSAQDSTTVVWLGKIDFL